MRDQMPAQTLRTGTSNSRRPMLATQLAAMMALLVGAAALRAAGQGLAPANDGASTAVVPLPPLHDSGVLSWAYESASPGVSGLPTVSDPNVQPCSYPIYSSGGAAVSNWTMQPASWIGGPYLKSGVSFILGHGLLVDNLKTGYSISGGARQPLAFGLGGDRTFVDLGGSYMSAFGETVRDTARVDTFIDDPTMAGTPVPPSVIVDDGLRATLTQVQRAGAHIGIGRMWGSPVDRRSEDPQFALATTIGGRLSHIHGRFDEQLIGSLTPPPAGAAGTTFSRAYSQTDSAGGLYGNVQGILLHRNSALGCLQLTADAEFAHDWIDLKGFEDRGLGTASVLFGVMFSR